MSTEVKRMVLRSTPGFNTGTLEVEGLHKIFICAQLRKLLEEDLNIKIEDRKVIPQCSMFRVGNGYGIEINDKMDIVILFIKEIVPIAPNLEYFHLGGVSFINVPEDAKKFFYTYDGQDIVACYDVPTRTTRQVDQDLYHNEELRNRLNA